MVQLKRKHWLLYLAGFALSLCLLLAFVHTIPHASANEANLATGGSGLEIPTGPGSVEISDSISKKSFGDTLLAMVNYFIGFLGFLATLAFVYAGVLWVLSGGSEDAIGKAKKIMTYAALGIIVVILSFSIVRFITSSAGTDTGPGSGTETNVECTSTADCPAATLCNMTINRCERIQDKAGKTEDPPDAAKSDPMGPAADDDLGKIDELLNGGPGEQRLDDALNLGDGALSDAAVAKIEAELNKAIGIDKKIDVVEDMVSDPQKYGLTTDDATRLESFLNALYRLRVLREQMNDLRLSMPESKDLIQAYDDASQTLDDLIEDPSDPVKYTRFETRYRKLKELIRKFPVVAARIRAIPGLGNVPLAVQFDGLDSVDPTGGTISDYRWSFLDNSGNEVSLGSGSVVIHEFAEANTYAVRLRASTSLKDADGYKTAADGVSVIRIKAEPPTNQVRFKINGAEVYDFFNVTLKESQASLSFDPASTTTSVGRKIDEYRWSFGDGSSEVRLQPTTVVHTYSKTGVYNVTLEVTDNLKVKDKKTVKVFVKSLASDIRITPPSSDVNTVFKFSGTGSRSDDGAINRYDWTIDDEDGKLILESEESTFTHRFSKPGKYAVNLVVRDVVGTQDKFTATVNVISRDPVASFVFDVPQKNHPNLFEFSAINSYDPDEGDHITYSWDFDGDGDFEIVDSDEATVTHEYLQVGDYKVKLQVKDGFERHDQSEKSISVSSVLSGDIEVSNLAVRVGEPLTFTANSPKASAYLWEFGDGETHSNEEKEVTHTYNKTGVFTVKLHFFDSDDNENIDSLRILAGASDEPVASIGYSINAREPLIIENLCGDGNDGALVSRNDNIQFDAKNSINTDGSNRLLAYDWRLPGGEKSANKETRYKFDEINREGECFEVNLVVRDTLSGKLSQEDVTYFKVINKIPEIKDFVITAPDSDTPVTPLKVDLKIVSPRDEDGSIKKYRWWYYREGFEDSKFGTHTTSTPYTDLTITSFGEADLVNRYYFVAELTDNDNGVSTTVERFGDVSFLDVKNGPNLSPVAEFNVDKTTVSTGDSVSFVSKSYDPQGDILPMDAFRWDFDGDGEFDDTSSGPQVNRQFNTPGEYTVRLKVVYRGLSSSASKTIFVEPTDSLPQAAFTYSIDGDTVSFDAAVSRFDSSLADTTLRYEWDFDVNDDANGNGIKDDDVQSTDEQTTFIFTAKKVYRVRLKVKDSLGLEGVVVRDINMNQTEAERQKNSYQSIKVTASHNPLTSLELLVTPSTLEKGGTADVTATVLNADGTPYNGKVYFEVLEGSGQFSPNPMEADGLRAVSVFTGLDSGKVRLRARATGTIYGDLTEEAVLTVK